MMPAQPHVEPAEVVSIVLSGGRGTRLYPLTRDRAKPAVGFGGKYRLIDIPLTNCLNAGLQRIYILTQFNSYSLNRHVWQTYSREVPRNCFIDVVAAEQTEESRDWFQGTADAVRQSLNHVLVHHPRYVLILSGDQIYSLDFRRLLAWHDAHDADVTIAGHYTAADAISGLGVIGVDADMRVTGFREKPPEPARVANFRVPRDAVEAPPPNRPFLCSMGIYLFNTEVLIQALDNDEQDFGRSVIPRTAAGRRMHCFPFDGYWEDVGTIEAFYRANMDWRSNRGIAESFHDGSAMTVQNERLPPTRYGRTKVEDSIVADGCHIRAAAVRRSIIGTRSRIDEGAVIEDSVVVGNAFGDDLERFEIGRDCLIRRAILDRNCVVGDRCRIVNGDGVQHADTELYAIRSGIVVVPRGSVLPPGTVI